MKSTFFAFLAFICATLVLATPTPTTPNLQARTCGKGQFWYPKKNCCLDHGGPKTIPNPPGGRDCPKFWYWHPGQKCCTPKFPLPPNPKPECGSFFPWWNPKNQCCENNIQPQASPQAVYNGVKSFYDKYKKFGGHRKAKKSRVEDLCPKGLEACPISGFANEFECVDPVEDVRACGGCPSLGKGKDCTAIPFAVHVGCGLQATCVVTSCEEGYTPSADSSSCVPVLQAQL